MSIRNYYKHLNKHQNISNILLSLTCISIDLELGNQTHLREVHSKALPKANNIVRNPKYFDILKFNNEERTKLKKSIEVLKKRKKQILPSMKEEIQVWKTKQAKKSTLLKTKSIIKNVKNDRLYDIENIEKNLAENKSKIICLPIKKDIVKIDNGSTKVGDLGNQYQQEKTPKDPVSILKEKQNKSMMKMLLSQPEIYKKTFKDYVKEKEINKKKEKFENIPNFFNQTTQSVYNEPCDSTLKETGTNCNFGPEIRNTSEKVENSGCGIHRSPFTSEDPVRTIYTCYPSGILKKPELMTETIEQERRDTDDHLLEYLNQMLEVNQPSAPKADISQESVQVQESLKHNPSEEPQKCSLLTTTEDSNEIHILNYLQNSGENENKLFGSKTDNESINNITLKENLVSESVNQNENSNLANAKSSYSIEENDKSLEYFKERYDEQEKRKMGDEKKQCEEQTAIIDSATSSNGDLPELPQSLDVSSSTAISQPTEEIIKTQQHSCPHQEIKSTLIIPYNNVNSFEPNFPNNVVHNLKKLQTNSVKMKRKIDWNLKKINNLYFLLQKKIVSSQRLCENFFKFLFESLPGLTSAIVRMMYEISVKQVYLFFNKMVDLKTNIANKSSYYLDTLSILKRRYVSGQLTMQSKLKPKQLDNSKGSNVIHHSLLQNRAIPKMNNSTKTLYLIAPKPTTNDKLYKQSQSMLNSLKSLYKQCLNEKKHQFPLTLTNNIKQLNNNSETIKENGQVVSKSSSKTIKVHSNSMKLLRQKNVTSRNVLFMDSVPYEHKVKSEKVHNTSKTQQAFETHKIVINERKPPKLPPTKKKNNSKLLNSEKNFFSKLESNPKINFPKGHNLNHPESTWQQYGVKTSARKYLNYLRKSSENQT